MITSDLYEDPFVFMDAEVCQHSRNSFNVRQCSRLIRKYRTLLCLMPILFLGVEHVIAYILFLRLILTFLDTRLVRHFFWQLERKLQRLINDV